MTRMTDEQRVALEALPETTFAYLAGLIDGEGHLGIHNGGSVFLEVSMTHRDTINWLKDTFGGALYTPTVPKVNARQYWKWTAAPTILAFILPRTLKFSITKRRHIEVAIELMSLRSMQTKEYRNGYSVRVATKPERQAELWQELKALNRRGAIPLQGANSAV